MASNPSRVSHRAPFRDRMTHRLELRIIEIKRSRGDDGFVTDTHSPQARLVPYHRTFL